MVPISSSESRVSNMAFMQFQYGISQYSEYLLKHDNEFKKVVIDTEINQPYIYYLFYSRFDPHKLVYSNPSKSNPKYKFSKVSKMKVEQLPVIFTADHIGTPLYNIYADGSTWYVKKMY